VKVAIFEEDVGEIGCLECQDESFVHENEEGDITTTKKFWRIWKRTSKFHNTGKS
jgi:hypothetical protein